jgi:hypothetical protein
MRDIKESDWKLFKPLRKLALNRFCDRVLAEVSRIISDDTKGQHERYLAMWRVLKERDREIDPIFDYLRRSTAVRQICAFRDHDLITDEEFRRFSLELIREVEHILSFRAQRLELVDENDPSPANETAPTGR